MEKKLQKMLMEQKDEGLENRRSFGSPYSPTSVSWRAVTCVEPRDRFRSVPTTELERGGVSQKTLFTVLAATGPGRGGTAPCCCVSTHPKTTSAKTEMSYAKRTCWTAFHPLQLLPDFVSMGVHTLKHCYLASSIQAERLAATPSLHPIPTLRQVSSKPLTGIPFPERDRSFSQGYEHTAPICIVTMQEWDSLIHPPSFS